MFDRDLVVQVRFWVSFTKLFFLHNNDLLNPLLNYISFLQSSLSVTYLDDLSFFSNIKIIGH